MLFDVVDCLSVDGICALLRVVGCYLLVVGCCLVVVFFGLVVGCVLFVHLVFVSCV